MCGNSDRVNPDGTILSPSSAGPPPLFFNTLSGDTTAYSLARSSLSLSLSLCPTRCPNAAIARRAGTETELKLSELDGPADPGLAKQQLDWLTERMAASTADYLWVGGHYPVWAIGQDPPTGVSDPTGSFLMLLSLLL